MNCIIEDVENFHIFETATGHKILRFVSPDGIASVYLDSETMTRVYLAIEAYRSLDPTEAV
jgi:hypothetical protein